MRVYAQQKSNFDGHGNGPYLHSNSVLPCHLTVNHRFARGKTAVVSIGQFLSARPFGHWRLAWISAFVLFSDGLAGPILPGTVNL